MPVSSTAFSCSRAAPDKWEKKFPNEMLQMELAGKDALSSLTRFVNKCLDDIRALSHTFTVEVVNARRHTVTNRERWAPNFVFEGGKLVHDCLGKCSKKMDFKTIELTSSFDTRGIGVPLLQLFPVQGKGEIWVDSAFYHVYPI